MSAPVRRSRSRPFRSRRWPAAVAVLTGMVLAVLPAAGAQAASGHGADGGTFSSSFEPSGPAPNWQSTPETGPGGHLPDSGVVPDSGGALPGSVMASVASVTAGSEVLPDHGATRAADGDAGTSWQADSRTPALTVTLGGATRVTRYAMTSAGDSPTQDPTSWALQGSDDGQSWHTLDSEGGQDFAQRGQTRIFTVRRAGDYSSYRLAVSANHGDSRTQLAELVLAAGDGGPAGMTTAVGSGPASGPTIKPNVGFTGTHALKYAGWQLAGHGSVADKVYQVSIPVRRDTRLSYAIFPERTGNDLAYPSTYVSVDLAFSDGTYLSRLGATDQYGKALTAAGQGAAKVLHAGQWNAVDADLGAVAAGRTVTRILVDYDNPGGPAHFSGWLDDIALRPAPAANTCAHPSTCVVTTRGTDSSGDYSRGNNFPATAVPHGFNFWTPETNAGTTSSIYTYQQDNNAANEPVIQAFGVSHEPSIWVQDHQTFQVMPSASGAPTTADRATRGLAFSHDHETAQPDYYGVTFDNGIRAEMTPTDHAAEMRFTFPGGDDSLIFDNVNDNGGLTVDKATGTVTGYSDVAGFWGAPRMFVYATFDRPMTGSGSLTGGGGPDVGGYTAFDLGGGHQLTMRIATSFISVDQARRNLEQEVGQRDFDAVHAAARAAWDKALGVVTVRGASQDQLTSLYSSLYRLNLYPNELYENTGTTAKPDDKYASPYSASAGPSSPVATGAAVKSGQPYANEGFWDTYRTAWPLDSLLYPQLTGKMIDGFVQQYRDGGWIGQWTAPGYLGFSGTNSDVAIADAYLRGVTDFDVRDAYEAAVKDATVPSSGITGRPDVQESTFLGYTPQTSGSSASVSLEDYLADYGIAQMSQKLASTTPASDPHHREYVDNARYFNDRAQHYVDLFDPSTGFFQPKNADGTFEHGASTYNPLDWNATDYTEGDGWTYAFAVPEDGNGLANLYGGRSGLADKLDQFFATPETAQYGGGIFGPYHEMFESRDDRIGQWAFNDQPSMDVPYMYDYVGQPAKAEQHVRDAMSRLFTGSTIGQGYPGDEDNGSMSAFYLDNALGLYPLQSGSPTFAVGSPLYDQVTLHPAGGRPLTITAHGNSGSNIYIQSMTVDGHAYDKTYLEHADLTRGGRIDLRMGSHPSGWGTAPADAPPSLTTGSAVADPPSDLTGPGKGTATAGGTTAPAALFDDTSSTEATLAAGAGALEYHFDQPQALDQYTLTSGAGTGGDPSAWTLSVSDDGTRWTTVDRRSGEGFDWRQQTRAFSPSTPTGSHAYYRIDFTGGTATTLSEVELLGR
ncbi:alpha-1,2-mannosidase, putative [Actinacidiphila yanglinensis]|uniref:Alpha-1,2-mannosidase, putative n=1 Tax=Actinacidiphila yanglinensis TaxID=310779 RepID=A0A1H6E2Q0_9ACTN|nr:GH92 family glycosyl hydrolase [Actinacidiphila yanglinensis]SEG91579.1 alpha-1,2-mannosidase, putative [Actinacidiphila yanglinensis]